MYYTILTNFFLDIDLNRESVYNHKASCKECIQKKIVIFACLVVSPLTTTTTRATFASKPFQY